MLYFKLNSRFTFCFLIVFLLSWFTPELGYSKYESSKSNKLSKSSDKIPLEEEIKLNGVKSDKSSQPDNKKTKFHEMYLEKGEVTEGDDFKLEQFGYDFFNKAAEFPQIMHSVGPDYLVGPGDELTIYLWGDAIDILKKMGDGATSGIDSILNLSVDRDGKIFFPRTGVYSVWGLTLTQVKDLLTKALMKKFTSFEISVSLSEIRSFPVYVVGEVAKPGTVLINGGSTIIDALIGAGGINKNGSLRNITLTKRNKKKENKVIVDLYDFLISGEVSQASLDEGDVIMIPTIGKTVAISGYVTRPGIYEITGTEGFSDIKLLAGGILPSGNTQRIMLQRYIENSKRVVIDLSSSTSMMNYRVSDGDKITIGEVYSIEENNISLQGAVKYPGNYVFKADMKLSDLIKSGDEILAETDFDYGEIIRTGVKGEPPSIISFSLADILKKKKDIALFPRDIVKIFNKWTFPQVEVSGNALIHSGKYSYWEGMRLTDALRLSKISSRSESLKADIIRDGNVFKVIFLQNLLQKKDMELDIALKPGDKILIRSIEKGENSKKVAILGEVHNPSSLELTDGMKLSDLITQAGGFNDRSYLPGAVLLRQSVKKAQTEKMKMSLLTLQANLITESAETAKGGTAEENKAVEESLKAKQELLQILKQKLELTTGRVVVTILKDFNEFKSSEFDITLEDGDELYIPAIPSYVLFLGEVYSQLGLSYIPGKKLNEYIYDQGGYTKTASKDEVYIVRADGKIINNYNYKKEWNVNWDNGQFNFIYPSFESITLSPGDAVIFPTEIKVPILWRPIIRDITSILAQSVTTIAILKTIGL